MTAHTDEFGQPIGAALFQAFSEDTTGKLWTYMASGPFTSEGDFMTRLEAASGQQDPVFHAIVDNSTNQALGFYAQERR